MLSNSRRSCTLLLLCALAVASGASIVGCAADSGSTSADLPGTTSGGQTGSLIPSCGLAPNAVRAPQSLQGGGVVFFPMGCPGEFDPQSLQLRAEDGMIVPSEVEELDTGAVVVRASAPLEPGGYTVVGEGVETEEVQLVDSEPAPSTLGLLNWTGNGCPGTFELELDEGLAAYSSQLSVSVSVDGGPWVTWFDYGTLETDGDVALITLPDCLGGCRSPGQHTVEVQGQLVGQDEPLPVVETSFTQRCPATGNCSASTPAGGTAWWLLLTAGPLWWRRRLRAAHRT